MTYSATLSLLIVSRLFYFSAIITQFLTFFIDIFYEKDGSKRCQTGSGKLFIHVKYADGLCCHLCFY